MSFNLALDLKLGLRETVASESGTTPLLDVYGADSWAAFSVRKLRTAYTGSCLRVRRSSDNAEQDIGFTGDGLLDVSTMETFVGANDGFITTWYDHTENGRDAVQTITTEQPQIVSNGTTYTDLNGLPRIYKPGVDVIVSPFPRLIIPSAPAQFADISIFATFEGNPASTSFVLYSTNNAYLGFGQDGSALTATSINISNRDYYVNGTSIGTDPTRDVLHTNYHSGSTVLATEYGNLDLAYTTTYPMGYLVNTAFCGDEYLQEYVIYDASKTSDQGNIESNINSYYQIYPEPTILGDDSGQLLEDNTGENLLDGPN